VVCYLVTALLFSLLILDLAAFVITLAPSKAIFKYTDLVYTGEQQGTGLWQVPSTAQLQRSAGDCTHHDEPPFFRKHI
jgi:hypothetical protein